LTNQTFKSPTGETPVLNSLIVLIECQQKSTLGKAAVTAGVALAFAGVTGAEKLENSPVARLRVKPCF